jgi:hypothetical protein
MIVSLLFQRSKEEQQNMSINDSKDCLVKY